MGVAGNKRIFVLAKDGQDKQIPVTPIFSVEDTVSAGKEKFDIRIQEISTVEDMRALDFLAQFHYKTNESLSERDVDNDARKPSNTLASGRHAILYASIKTGERWIPAGYIDLQMPLMMCKPRHELFNHPFTHPERDIAWNKWNQHAMKSYLNMIVRIGRVVVSPELRGLGITRRIIKAAKCFSVERWHIGGMRPIFMEISAEMLTHIDFVSSSGFKFIGKTEGNIDRIIKDMKQMERSPSGDFGIMTLQRKYFRALETYCKSVGMSFDDGLNTLRKKIEQNQGSHSTVEWAVLRSIMRKPIPYFLCPLDDYTALYLRGAQKKYPPTQMNSVQENFSARNTQISVKNMSIRASYNIPETKLTKIIMDAFGLQGDIVYSDLVQGVSVNASNGNIILVVGASGSGKSIFLKALDPAKNLDGNLSIKKNGTLKYRAGWLKSIRDDIPVFEALAEKYTPDRTFVALSRVGLSEAFAFIKPFWMLSRGQQYRAMIADLLLRDDEVWLLDEFCSDLDPLTAKIVAYNLRKHVIATGRIAFIAAANHAHYLDSLRPTRVLMLRPGDMPTWLSFKEYQNGFISQVS